MEPYPGGYNKTIQLEIAKALIEAERTCTGPNASSIVGQYALCSSCPSWLTDRRLRYQSPAYQHNLSHSHEDPQRMFLYFCDTCCVLPHRRPCHSLGSPSRAEAVSFDS